MWGRRSGVAVLVMRRVLRFVVSLYVGGTVLVSFSQGSWELRFRWRSFLSFLFVQWYGPD